VTHNKFAQQSTGPSEVVRASGSLLGGSLLAVSDPLVTHHRLDSDEGFLCVWSVGQLSALREKILL